MHLFLQQLLLLGIVTSLLFLLKKIRKNGSKTPPGPQGFPLIGNFHNFVQYPHLWLHEQTKIYGPLMYFKLGFKPTLVVSSPKMAEQVMKTLDQIFCSRPALTPQQKLSYNGLDVVFAPYGDYWREVRKLCVIQLFSSKKVTSFSPVREEEVYEMMKDISGLSEEGKVVDLSEMMTSLTSRFICRIAFGKKYDGANAECKQSFRSFSKGAQQMFTTFCYSDFFPGMGWIDKLKGTSARLHSVFTEWDDIYQEVIDDHLHKTGRPGEEDIVDVLLKLQREESLGFPITHDHIKALLMDILLPGTETSAATVVWAMTELMRNPKAMKRLQEETRALMMGNKAIDMIKAEDFEKLVYLKAVVKETMRLHPLAPLLVPRETTQKCTIEGYEIPEGTLVFVNAWTIGRDPETWENPEEFVPERFLGNTPIDLKGQDYELVPFGSGRRICPGMKMGLAMVELALVNLICLFDWELPSGMEAQALDTSIHPGVALHKKLSLCLLAKKVC